MTLAELVCFIAGLACGAWGIILLKKPIWRWYDKEIKAHAETVKKYEQCHRQWATELQKRGIQLVHNGRVIEPMPNNKDEDWPEVLN